MCFVRQATLEDLPALALFDEWNTVTEARLEAGHCFVAGLHEQPLAIGVFDRSFMNRPFIAIIYVHADHRRSGLASVLITHFESLTTGPKLWVSTNIENLAMQSVLHKHGYSLAGVVNDLGALPELFYFKQVGPAS